uniref:Glycosyltransferase cazy family gt77-like protein n=1 Tax=Tetraselmis sp. GSL018 TaxID=582737 RepID=A0A061SJT2_9CHLO
MGAKGCYVPGSTPSGSQAWRISSWSVWTTRQVMRAVARLGVACWRADPVKGADKQASNHGISALKFQLVREFLVLGYSVLLSDVDVVVLQNPFGHLHRDHDVEALSDGFDERTAYGGWDDVFDDPQMGWSRYAHTIRLFMVNSGLFYVRPSSRTVELMDRLTERLSREAAWDQAAFNEALFLPSHGGYLSPRATVRVMDIYKFVNSKTLFKSLRGGRGSDANRKPVMVHINYHPDKWQRMKAVIKRYLKGDSHALDGYPLGVH